MTGPVKGFGFVTFCTCYLGCFLPNREIVQMLS